MSWDISDIKKWNWKQHPAGAVIRDPGNSRQVKTGGWRSLRPIHDDEKCNSCFICYIYCPEASIKFSEDEFAYIDLDFCKGCGICAEECPRDAIEMIDEIKAQSKESAKS